MLRPCRIYLPSYTGGEELTRTHARERAHTHTHTHTRTHTHTHTHAHTHTHTQTRTHTHTHTHAHTHTHTHIHTHIHTHQVHRRGGAARRVIKRGEPIQVNTSRFAFSLLSFYFYFLFQTGRADTGEHLYHISMARCWFSHRKSTFKLCLPLELPLVIKSSSSSI
jgi:hypothetical protein